MPSMKGSGSTPYWVESIGYFLFTYIILKYKERNEIAATIGMTVLMIILGKIILEIPLRIALFTSTLGSLMIPISCIIAILLGAYCFKKKSSAAFIISYIILSLYNSIVPDLWLKFLESHCVW